MLSDTWEREIVESLQRRVEFLREQRRATGLSDEDKTRLQTIEKLLVGLVGPGDAAQPSRWFLWGR